MSLQACASVTLDDVVVLGESCQSGRDTSLNLLVLVYVSGAVSQSQADEAYWYVVNHYHQCLRIFHLQTLIFTFISSFL